MGWDGMEGWKDGWMDGRKWDRMGEGVKVHSHSEIPAGSEQRTREIDGERKISAESVDRTTGCEDRGRLTVDPQGSQTKRAGLES